MRKRTYLRLAAYQTEQSRQHLAEVRSIHAEMRGYKHDFHSHLQTLRGLLAEGEYERAMAYIDELDERLQNVDTLLKTGNVTLDDGTEVPLARGRYDAVNRAYIERN